MHACMHACMHVHLCIMYDGAGAAASVGEKVSEHRKMSYKEKGDSNSEGNPNHRTFPATNPAKQKPTPSINDT